MIVSERSKPILSTIFTHWKNARVLFKSNSSRESEIDLHRPINPSNENERSSTRRILTATTILSMTVVGAIFSLPATSYLSEAEKRGLTPSEYESVFSVYDLAAVVISLFSPLIIQSINYKSCLILGLAIEGIFCCSMGLLAYVQRDLPFYCLAVLFRFLNGIAEVLIYISLIAMAGVEFPDAVGFYVSLMEAGYGLGGILGTFFGGILFDVQGLLLPFFTFGIASFILMVISCIAVPSFPSSVMFKISDFVDIVKDSLKTFLVWTDLAAIMFSFSMIALLDATLEPHLELLSLSASKTGAIFLSELLTYVICSPVLGKLCDGGISTSKCKMYGCFFIAVGISFVGPIPWIPLQPTIYLTVSGLIVLGVAEAAVIVPSFISLKMVCCQGDPRYMEQYVMVAAGLFMLAMSIGGVIGPVLGGVLSENFGFRFSTLYGVTAGLALAVIIFIDSRIKRNMILHHT